MSSFDPSTGMNLQTMIMCFRVPELQSLLAFAGKNKSGRKQDLVNRSLQLIESSSGNQSISNKVQDLYHQRCPGQISKTDMESKMEGCDDGSPLRNNSSVLPTLQFAFKALPFYHQEVNLLPPTSLQMGKSYDVQQQRLSFNKMKITFQIQQAHLPILESHRRQRPFSGCLKISPAQVQLRFSLIGERQKQPERLPPQINVRLNDQLVVLPPLAPQTKAGDDPRHFNRPINLTPQSCKPGRNKLCIKWSASSEQQYAFVVNIVRQQSVDDLLVKLHKRGVRPIHETKKDIKKMLAEDADAEISTMCLKVSLLCPLGKMRMKTPARAKTCSHLQCFDINFFLKMNENKPTWMCPVCDKPADFDNIQVDQYFAQILAECNEDEIEFNEDGSWYSTNAKKNTAAETFVINSSKNYDNALDLRWPHVNGKKEEKSSTQNDVIDLTGDTTDEEDEVTNLCQSSIGFQNAQVDLVSSPPVSSRSSASTPYQQQSLLTANNNNTTATNNNHQHHQQAPPPPPPQQQWASADEQLMTPPLPHTPKSSNLSSGSSSSGYHGVRRSPRERLRFSPVSPYRGSRNAVETPPPPILELNSLINTANNLTSPPVNSTSSSRLLDPEAENSQQIANAAAAAAVASGLNGYGGSPSIASIHPQLPFNQLFNLPFCQTFSPAFGGSGLNDHTGGFGQRQIYDFLIQNPTAPSPHAAYQQQQQHQQTQQQQQQTQQQLAATQQQQLQQQRAVAMSSAAAAAANAAYTSFFPDLLMQAAGHHSNSNMLQHHHVSTPPPPAQSAVTSSTLSQLIMSNRSASDRHGDPSVGGGGGIPID